jgi:hypothetical protein
MRVELVFRDARKRIEVLIEQVIVDRLQPAFALFGRLKFSPLILVQFDRIHETLAPVHRDDVAFFGVPEHGL